MIRKIFSIGILMLSVYPQVEAQKKSASQLTLFTVADKTISVEEFVYLYKKNHQGRSEEFTKDKIEEYLELFVKFKLKVKEAETRGMDTTEAFISELNTYKEELKKPFVAEPDILDELVKQTYERLKQEVKASHILITANPEATPADTIRAYNKANELRARIIAGEPFEKLAREFSDDPSAKSNGGNLGYFTALQMVFPFEETAYNLKLGEVSQPVRTRFGYHLIKVDGRRPSSGEVEVSHILVRGADDQAKKTIEEVHEKLMDEGDWKELCSQYSQDPATKDNEGKLRPFGPGTLASAPKFEEVAFSMKEPGSISTPFQTAFGWHIIKLERKIPLPPFSELEESLKKRVARDDRMIISKSIALEKRKRKLSYKEDSLLRDRLSKIADSSLIKGKWDEAKVNVISNKTLFSVGEAYHTVGSFADFIVKNQRTTNVSPEIYVRQLYEKMVEEILSAAEDKLLQQQNPEYRNLVNEYREGILLFSIMEQEVWNKASEDSVGQRNYYNANVEKYKADLRLEARIFSTSDKNFLDEIRNKIEAGDTLRNEDLSRFKTVTKFRKFEKGENAAIDSIPWVIGLHETEADGMYYLVDVNSLVQPGAKLFEEVRANVISDYQDELERQWIAELRKKYAVKINSKGKKRALAELTSKR